MTDTLEHLRDSLAARYELQRELGRGGMATVYLARDLKHDRLVALKVLAPELAATLGLQRFSREIRLTAGLEHPHIVPVLDSGEDAGRLWYTMPYVEGESLRDRLRRETQLPVAEAMRLAGEVAGALAYAHGRGIVHRDIKPENILLSQGHARVSDFGVARADGDREGLTAAGLALGTPSYMSPEHASGEKADARSDLYALGCVLYEMLAGEPPFTGPTAQSIIMKAALGPVPSVRTTRPDVPLELDVLISRLLSPVPAARPASAAEVAAALRTASLPSGTIAAPGHRAGRRAAVALGIVALLVAGAGIAWRTMGRPAPEAAGSMIAVLPFKNLGAPADAYFAEGLTEELTSRLALIGELGVISRTSADQYRDTRKSLREIGEELGARYVLEGSVRWEGTGEGSRIRVTPQLIDVTTDRHVWTDRYDARFTEVFAVQAAIAEKVAAALGVTLAGTRRQALASEPTANFDAYTAYLQGEAVKGNDPAALRKRLELFTRAAALDTAFAEAHVEVGFAHLRLFQNFIDPSRERLELFRGAVERALRLRPDLSEGHVALGVYHLIVGIHRDSAEAGFARAVALQPNNASAVRSLGSLHMMAGRWDEAVSTLERARAMDPRSSGVFKLLSDAHRFRRDYPAAHRHAERAVAVAPDDPDAWLAKATLEQTLGGDPAQARATLRAAVELFGMARLARSYYGDVLLMASDPAYADSARRLTIGDFAGDSVPYYYWRMILHDRAGDSAQVRAYADSGAAVMGRLSAAAPTMGAHIRSVRGLFDAFGGRRRQAVEGAAAAVAEEPVSRDAYNNTRLMINQAVVHMVVGDHAGAVRILKDLLEIPSEISVPALQTDPMWQRLRRYPGFQRLGVSGP